MTVNLADPQWIAIILTILLAVIGGTFGIAKILFDKPEQNHKSHTQLTDEQLYSLIQMHENSVSSEIARMVAIFLYSHDIRKQKVTEASLQDLKRRIWASIRGRRELLRVFQLPSGTLEQYMTQQYDPQFEHDYERLKQVALENISYFERLERINSALEQIQVDLRLRVRQDLSIWKSNKR